MPIRCPAGALPDAYRVICLHSVRALASGHAVSYHFRSSSSEKCEHCTENNGACEPVPDYVGEEFAALKYALDVWEEDGISDDTDKWHDHCLKGVTAAAKSLLLMASHDVLRMLLVQVTRLGDCLASIQAKVCPEKSALEELFESCDSEDERESSLGAGETGQEHMEI